LRTTLTIGEFAVERREERVHHDVVLAVAAAPHAAGDAARLEHGLAIRAAQQAVAKISSQ
jgi:hypothetical protein